MENKTKIVGFRPSPETRKLLERAAKRTGASLTWLCEQCLKAQLPKIIQKP